MTETTILYIGAGLVEPIIELYKILEKKKLSGSTKLRVSLNENGPSVSLILSCAAFIESTINRMRYFENSHERCNLTFFKNRFSGRPIADKIEEVYILRDLLIHAHVWKATLSYKHDTEIIHTLDKLPEYGDGKYKNNIDVSKHQTKNLGLSIIPTKVGKKEVITVFKVLREFLELMEKESNLHLNIHYRYNNKSLTFKEFLKLF